MTMFPKHTAGISCSICEWASLVAQTLLRICLQCWRPGFNPWVRKFPWRGNGNPLQYSCLENSMDRGTWQVVVYGIAKSWT